MSPVFENLRQYTEALYSYDHISVFSLVSSSTHSLYYPWLFTWWCIWKEVVLCNTFLPSVCLFVIILYNGSLYKKWSLKSCFFAFPSPLLFIPLIGQNLSFRFVNTKSPKPFKNGDDFKCLNNDEFWTAYIHFISRSKI